MRDKLNANVWAILTVWYGREYDPYRVDPRYWTLPSVTGS